MDIFRAKVVDVSPKSYTIEITGDEEKISAIIELLAPVRHKGDSKDGRDSDGEKP